jgi:tetratricopeptide (TPR) repeat protein
VKKTLSIFASVLVSLGPLGLTATGARAFAAQQTGNEQTLERVQAALDKGNKPSQKDFDDLGAILQQEPENARVHLVAGMAFESMGLAEQAIEQYNLAVKLSPDDPKPMVDLLKSRIRFGEGESATHLIELAHNKFPNDPDVNFIVGWDALKQGKLAIAYRALGKAMAAKPDIPWLNVTYGELMLQERNYEEAWKYAAKELARDPAHPPAKAQMVAGLSLAHMKRREDAIKYLGPACIATPKDTRLSSQLARLSVWCGRYTDAIDPCLLYFAVSAKPFVEDSEMRALLLDCFRHSSKEEALKRIDDINKNFTPAWTNAAYHNLVGELEAQMGWHDVAIESFKTAVKLDPGLGIAQFNLGKDYEQYEHDYENALACYRKAEQLRLPEKTPVVDYATRLEERLTVRKGDLSWHLRDLLSQPHH